MNTKLIIVYTFLCLLMGATNCSIADEKGIRNMSSLNLSEIASNTSTSSDLYLNAPIEFRFLYESDLANFADELYESAKRDDGESQYYLDKVIMTCASVLLTQHEMLENKLSVYDMGLERRCSRFSKDKLESLIHAGRWTEKARDNGYFLAEMLLFDSSPDQTEAKLAQLIERGVRSMHPDAFHIIALMSESTIGEKVWNLLSCDYGFHCEKHFDSNSMFFKTWHQKAMKACTLVEDTICDLDDLKYVDYLALTMTNEELKKVAEKKIKLQNAIKDEDFVTIVDLATECKPSL